MAKLGFWAWAIFIGTCIMGFKNTILVFLGAILLGWILGYLISEYEMKQERKELERKYGKPNQQN